VKMCRACQLDSFAASGSCSTCKDLNRPTIPYPPQGQAHQKVQEWLEQVQQWLNEVHRILEEKVN
jgi:hypothetical protein